MLVPFVKKLHQPTGDDSQRDVRSFGLPLHEIGVTKVLSCTLCRFINAYLWQVKDYVFINGYIQPTLLILHEEEPSALNRIHWKKNTICATAIAFNVRTQNHSIIWQKKGLENAHFFHSLHAYAQFFINIIPHLRSTFGLLPYCVGPSIYWRSVCAIT